VAEAFCRAYERWPRVRAMRSPGGWVYRVALNDLRRRLRRRQLEHRLLRRSNPAPPPALAVDPDLWDAVAALPPRQREAVVLRYVADQTERVVASVLGISEGAVSSALVAARRTLAAELDRQETTR
jgi:RNA polymerase sigma-70 factor, ECF subfamily